MTVGTVLDVLGAKDENATGQKLNKTVFYSDSIKIVDYLDGFQYAGGELNFFPHPEGYVNVKRGGRTAPDGSQGYVFNYVYNYTDHLGNIRVSYSKDPQTHQLKILEENHYYPFGLKHSVYTAGRLRDFEVDFSNPEGEHVFLTPVTKTEYQYKYNGQEWQDELGLNMYAMDLRQYDPAIGRWVAQDPVIHHSMSPYNAFDNNPVFWADPSGADAVNIGYDREVAASEFSGSATSFKLDNIIESKETKRYTAIVGGDEPTQDTSNLTIDPCTSDYLSGSSAKTYNFTNTTYKRASSRGSTFGDLFSLPDYIRNAYKNNYDPRFSPYTPDAMSLNIGFSANLYLFNFDVSASLIFSPGNTSLGGSYSAGLGVLDNATVLNHRGSGFYGSMGFHDTYGGETNVLDGLRGPSTNTNVSLGPVNVGQSKSLSSDGVSGVKSTTVGL